MVSYLSIVIVFEAASWACSFGCFGGVKYVGFVVNIFVPLCWPVSNGSKIYG